MKLEEVLSIKDELNLFLAANAMKPASMIYLEPYKHNLRNEPSNGVKQLVDHLLNRRCIIDGHPDFAEKIESFQDIMDGLGVLYYLEDRYYHNPPCLSYKVARKKDDLEKVVKAYEILRDPQNTSKMKNENFGLALGYPKEACESFKKVIDGEKRDGVYLNVCLARAKQKGIKLPAWLAYISFVPEKLDLINGDVSESSKALGERYMEFVKANNPDLASRVEKRFFNQILPDDWEMTPSGSYNRIFKKSTLNG